jgi:hypothetical protein
MIESNELHKCTSCKNIFEGTEHLKIHIYLIHIAKIEHTCELCDKVFINKSL